MAAPIITEKQIRTWIMDKPELNPLLRGVRFSDEDIDEAIVTVVSYFNEANPPTGASYTVENFPFRYASMVGTVGHLLRGAAINEASNNLTYSLDGTQVNDKDKAEIFTRLGNEFWTEFKERVQTIKTNQNVSQAFGSNGSEHRFYNW